MNASFVFDAGVSVKATCRGSNEEECEASAPRSDGGSIYIASLSNSNGDERQHDRPINPSIQTQYSEFGEDDISPDFLECSNVINDFNGQTLPIDTEVDEEDELSDMETAVNRFSNAREEMIGSPSHTNFQADSRTEKDTRAIDVLRCLICTTHIFSLVVSLSAALTSNSVTMTQIHVIFMILLYCTSFALFWARERRMDDRRSSILETAAESNAMVDSLFPEVVRDRLFGNKKYSKQKSKESNHLSSHRIFTMTPKRRLGEYLSNKSPTDQSAPETYADEPIAEIFHETTIMFADIVGFTAWSSEREPAQVFTLLETVYRAFDEVARKLKVFKVETIGDCYVAVAGLPEPRSDHAIVMAVFAWECRKLMGNLTKCLETSLGPGTSDLALRIGLHSGSVTAGVLRGEKSRFQLFGDTMNTASRIESTSKSGMIQVSQSTADLIFNCSKSHWLTARDDLVFAKGKGMMKTWWVQPHKSKSASFSKYRLSSERLKSSIVERTPMAAHWGTLSFVAGVVVPADKEGRLVDWCTDILSHSLAGVVSARNAVLPQRRENNFTRRMSRVALAPSMADTSSNGTTDHNIYPEVSKVVELPIFNQQKVASINNDPSILSAEVRDQLRDFVANIATRYHDNDFHNFEHASHVLLSANKLMKRIISPDSIGASLNPDKIDQEDVHNSSFGISSDPLTQFTIMLSALVHDVEHTGVPNTVLVAEHDDLAIKYANKSVAEQNSVDITLSLLSWPRFQELRAAIHATTTERDLFHQILVNAVVATDILVDEDLNNSRHERRSKAFAEEEDACLTLSKPNAIVEHRKVNAVIAHIIQASDVAHTMQHWHVFRQWNEKLFMEKYQSFKNHRCKGFTSMDWYMNEISFFDDYIIPLAQKLKESGVFGLSSDECLNYALANRDEWISKGSDIAKQLVAKADAKFIAGNEKADVFASSIGRAA